MNASAHWLGHIDSDIQEESTQTFAGRGNTLIDALSVLVLVIPVYKNTPHTHFQAEVTHLVMHSVCGS